MRTPFAAAVAALVLGATPLFAAQAPGEPVDLLSPSGGLMLWTLLIFIGLLLVLSKFAFKPLLASVEAREQRLQETIDAARADREAAAALLAEHRLAVENARGEVQRIIAEGRVTAEEVQQQMMAETRTQQEQMLARARQEIELDKLRAIAELRREAVDLAIRGASRVIEENLDTAANRKLVEAFLATVPPASQMTR